MKECIQKNPFHVNHLKKSSVYILVLLWRFLLSPWELQVPQGKTAFSTLPFFSSFFPMVHFPKWTLLVPVKFLTSSALLSTSLVCPASFLLGIQNWPSGNCFTWSRFFYLNFLTRTVSLTFFSTASLYSAWCQSVTSWLQSKHSLVGIFRSSNWIVFYSLFKKKKK